MTASVDEKAIKNFKLGHDINSGPHSIKFTTDRPVPGSLQLPVQVTPFVPSPSGRELGTNLIKAWATLDADREHGTLFFCLDPEERLKASGGEFTGALVLTKDRVERLDVPVTLTIAYPRAVRVMFAGLAVAFASSWYVYFLRRPRLSPLILYGRALRTDEAGRVEDAEGATRVLRTSFGFWMGYWRWASSATGGITVVAGLIGAVTALAPSTWPLSHGRAALETGSHSVALWPLPSSPQEQQASLPEPARRALSGNAVCGCANRGHEWTSGQVHAGRRVKSPGHGRSEGRKC